jgi:hypothetical protein
MFFPSSLMHRRRLVLLCMVVLALSAAIAGCMVPSFEQSTPAGVLREYVLAYNRGDAAAIHALLLPHDHPASQGQYTQQSIAGVLNQTRYGEGIRIADYTILEQEMVDGEAFVRVRVTWEAGDGSRVVMDHDLAMIRYQGEWRLTGLLLPTTPGEIV